MLTIENLFRPLSTKDFIEKHYGHSHLHLRGESDRWSSVFSWTQLNQALSSQRLECPRLRLVKNGSEIDQNSYSEPITPRLGNVYRRLRMDRLAATLQAGATLVLDQVDELSPSSADLAFELEHFFRVPVTMNLYVTWGEVEGFDIHWDDHDVFVLQLAGSKRWRIFQPTRMWPLERDSEVTPRPEDPPLADLHVRTGHFLYVPHGWWHVANAQDSPSMHITISLKQSSAVDLLSYAIDRLRRHEIIRQRIPRFVDAEERQQYTESIQRLLMQTIATSEIIDDYIRHFEVNRNPRPGASLPISTGDIDYFDLNDDPCTLLAPLARVETTPDSVILAACGRQWTFAVIAEPVLRALVTSRRFTIRSLMTAAGNRLSENQVRSILVELIKAGVVSR